MRRGEGIKRDLTTSIAWLEKSADQGHVFALHDLAVAYELGLGVEADNARSLDFYKKAGERDHRPAIERLTRVYTRGGLGQNPDPREARAWGQRLNAAARARPPEI